MRTPSRVRFGSGHLLLGARWARLARGRGRSPGRPRRSPIRAWRATGAWATRSAVTLKSPARTTMSSGLGGGRREPGGAQELGVGQAPVGGARAVHVADEQRCARRRGGRGRPARHAAPWPTRGGREGRARARELSAARNFGGFNGDDAPVEHGEPRRDVDGVPLARERRAEEAVVEVCQRAADRRRRRRGARRACRR